MGLKTIRIGIISGLLVLMFILVASASAQLTIPTPPLPPFLDNLTVIPPEIERGDNVTISFTITYIDNQPFSYIAKISVKGIGCMGAHIEDLTILVVVELEAYEYKTVSRTITQYIPGDYNVTVDGLTGSFTVKAPPLPAMFEVSDLSITPDKVKLGWDVIISFTVTNIGEQTGSYFVNLKIDGVPTAGMTGELEPGESEVRSYWLTPERPGDYSVEVDGRIGSFTLEAPPPIVIKPTPPKLAEFEVIVNDFQVHPLGIEVEDEDEVWTFRISYNVTNVGDYYGNYSVRSKIDGTAVDSNVFFLEAGETQSYLFEVERGIGTYQVEVEEFTESIEVTLIHKRSFWDKIPGFPYESIILGLVAAIIILWGARARKF